MNKAKFTNNTNIGLSMAVYLATDLYDHNSDPKTISATTLIKSIKQIILPSRLGNKYVQPDLMDRVNAQSGTALHTAAEWAWLNNYRQAMCDLGYPNSIIDAVRVNPTKEEVFKCKELGQKIYPIYLEQRSSKKVHGWVVTGKFDFVVEGRLEDIKRTSTYTYTKKVNDKKYIQQGSLYKWLNPEIITSDFMTIQFEFSDWKAYELKQRPDTYPPHKMMGYPLALASVQQTENYVSKKILEIEKYWKADEQDMPICTKEDLWMDDSVYKYWKNPQSEKEGKRSTKNFSNAKEAYARLVQDGDIGIVVEVKGEAKACNYCAAYPICKQKDNYIIK